LPLSPTNDEPVAYLGGKSAQPDDGPVEGYLGGEAPPEALPALPPAEQQYSASDFIAAPPEPAPPPADDYADEAPVEAPAEDPQDYQQYGAEEVQGGDTGTSTIQDAPASEQTSEFDEPGLPKTISQQDAENIIKRITTKKILPPEVAASEGPRVTSSELTRRRGGKAGPLLVLVVILLGGAAGVFYFKDDIGPYLPKWAQEFIGYNPPEPEPTPEAVPTMTPEQKAQKALKDIVYESEYRAFGYTSKEDADKRNKVPGSDAPGGGPAPAPAPAPDASKAPAPPAPAPGDAPKTGGK
jgi:hypothetical protein